MYRPGGCPCELLVGDRADQGGEVSAGWFREHGQASLGDEPGQHRVVLGQDLSCCPRRDLAGARGIGRFGAHGYGLGLALMAEASMGKIMTFR